MNPINSDQETKINKVFLYTVLILAFIQILAIVINQLNN